MSDPDLIEELPRLISAAARAFTEGDLPRAREGAMIILGLDPTNSAAHNLLGLIAASEGKYEDSLRHFRMAVNHDPDNVSIRYNYAVVLQSLGNTEARKQYEWIISRHPDHIAAANNLCSLLGGIGEGDAAENLARRIAAADPRSPVCATSLANILKDNAKIDEAIHRYRTALHLDPSYQPAISGYLLCLNYATDLDRETVFSEHLRWAQGSTGSIPAPQLSINGPDKIRVGYLSPDFHRHSVAFFIQSILQHHDRGKFEIFCYSDVTNPDDVTTALQRLDVHWRDIRGASDRTAKAVIESDSLHILVDLAGHAGGLRTGLLRNRLAPVQISWLGYPNTTGLLSMDYRIVDTLTDPPGEERYCTEKLLRLENGFLCYSPPPDAPAVRPPPCLDTGLVTFGSFNNFPKVNDWMIDLWATVLTAVPGSRLLLKARSLYSNGVRDGLIDRFGARGISAGRLILKGLCASMEEHLDSYGLVDIALDTAPYNGTTTTCEALWMGVPVVTLSRSCHAGRVGESLLTRIGLAGMVARTPERYVEIAAYLASDRTRLSGLRTGLRAALADSPVCDGPGFTAKLEEAYRKVVLDRNRGQQENN